MKARSGRKTSSAEAPEILLAIRTIHEYDAAVARLNDLVDEIGDNPKDPRYRLIETLSLLIEAYDREHHGLPAASVVDVIRFLMEQHGLTQKTCLRSGARASSPRCLPAAGNSTYARSGPSPHASAFTPAHS